MEIMEAGNHRVLTVCVQLVVAHINHITCLIKYLLRLLSSLQV